MAQKYADVRSLASLMAEVRRQEPQ
jgi:hypothetical protein